jgi:hypothetical protein
VASRSSDIKLIAGATVAVLVAGFLIAGGILVATRGSRSVVCPQLNVGEVSGVRRTLGGGPFFQTGGAGCGFWLALADGDIVAYKVEQPGGCALRRDDGQWRCDGRTLAETQLAQYPVSLQRIDDADSVVVDLRPRATATTTSLPAGTPPT